MSSATCLLALLLSAQAAAGTTVERTDTLAVRVTDEEAAAVAGAEVFVRTSPSLAVAPILGGGFLEAQQEDPSPARIVEAAYFGGYGGGPSRAYTFGGTLGVLVTQTPIYVVADFSRWEGETIIVCGASSPCVGVRPRGSGASLGVKLEGPRWRKLVPYGEGLGGVFSRDRVGESAVRSLGMTAELGVRLPFARVWGLSFAGRYMRVFDEAYDDQAGNPLQYTVATVGLWYRFLLE